MTVQTPQRPKTGIKSPCISVCEIDRQAKLCRGCGRTLAEIAGWIGYSDDEREAIMADLPARMAQLGKGGG